MIIGLLSICTLANHYPLILKSLQNAYRPIDHIKLDQHLLNKLRPTLFYPYTVSVNKCGGSWNTIDDPYAPVGVLNKVKHINVTVFNLISGVNETRFLVQHQSCECKSRLNESL